VPICCFALLSRTVSGVRNAEMKWTNHDRLSIYGVRVVGWPQTIPLQNPSTLTTSQNKALLECLTNGTLHFVRIMNNIDSANRNHPTEDPVEAVDDLSWVYEEFASVCAGTASLLALSDLFFNGKSSR
jgi:hypothetical protein